LMQVSRRCDAGRAATDDHGLEIALCHLRFL
jgi:hypothetical protein